VQKGWLVAVVGPTGAGKTSLARALTGGLAVDAGSVRLDGVDLATASTRDRDRVGFVPQDDVLHGELCLGRTLAYAASLRVPADAGPGERTRRVEAALRELGLQHHADVPVSSLSGGQRKRANIAAELVGQPEVLVLDEPTSGLDPGYEKAVMTTLRQLADGGRTVIAVTHSMAALEHCDRVLFLAEGGRVAYFGPPARAAAYFGRDDAADVFLALDTEPGVAWQRRFRSHPAYARYVAPVLTVAGRAAGERRTPAEPGRDRPGWLRQVGTLLRRQVALLRSDRRHLGLLVLQAPVLGVLLWLVLRPDSLGLMPDGSGQTPGSETVAMFVALSATWLGASNAAREIVKERHILGREVAAGLSPSAYVVSKAVVLGVMTAVQSVVLATIACLGQAAPAHGALLSSGRVELALAAAAVGLAASALGLFLSAVATSPDKALALLPMTLVAELALAGRWAASIDTPGLTLLRDVTGAHWGVEAFTATLAGDGASLARTLAVLGVLTAVALAAAAAMVRRHTRPALAPRAPTVRVDALRILAHERGSAVVGAAAAGVLVVALAIVAGGGAGAGHGGPGTPAVAQPPAEAELAAPVGPVETAPPLVDEAPVAVPVAVAQPAATPTTTSPPTVPPTTAAPATTVPAPSTTSTTTYTTPSTSPPPPSTGVGAASSGPAWWSPWFWLTWASAMGG
jgi:ABC-type multidrug transport system ATPase subunit